MNEYCVKTKKKHKFGLWLLLKRLKVLDVIENPLKPLQYLIQLMKRY